MDMDQDNDGIDSKFFNMLANKEKRSYNRRVVCYNGPFKAIPSYIMYLR